jgi:hypothetical protein
MKPHVSPEVVFGSRNPNENIARRAGRAALEQVSEVVNRRDLNRWNKGMRTYLSREVRQFANSQRDILKGALNGVKYSIADEDYNVEAYGEYNDAVDGTIWTLCVPNPKNDNFSVFMVRTFALGEFQSRPADEQWMMDCSVIDQETGNEVYPSDYRKNSEIGAYDSIERALRQLMVAEAAGTLIAEELPGPTPLLQAA